jgi:hypothetical protein
MDAGFWGVSFDNQPPTLCDERGIRRGIIGNFARDAAVDDLNLSLSFQPDSKSRSFERCDRVDDGAGPVR